MRDLVHRDVTSGGASSTGRELDLSMQGARPSEEFHVLFENIGRNFCSASASLPADPTTCFTIRATDQRKRDTLCWAFTNHHAANLQSKETSIFCASCRCGPLLGKPATF